MTNREEYIYTIYQEKSISRAARKLHVSQPWLSATLKKTEEELGLTLFDRDASPLAPTPEGELYHQHIQRVMDSEREFRRQLEALQNQSRNVLNVGSSMFFCTYVLPRLLSDFCLLYPQVSLSFSEGSGQALRQKLLEGKLDFVFEAERLDDERLQAVPWASEEIMLAVPAGCEINGELARYQYSFEEFLKRDQAKEKKPAVPLERFRDENFLLLKEGNDIRQRSLRLCKNAGFVPRSTLSLSQMMTAYYLVCEGRGVAFLRSTIPEYVAPTDCVVFYRLDDILAVRSIYLTFPRQKLLPLQQRLLDFLQEDARLE